MTGNQWSEIARLNDLAKAAEALSDEALHAAMRDAGIVKRSFAGDRRDAARARRLEKKFYAERDARSRARWAEIKTA